MNNTISYQNRLFQNRRPTNNKEYNDLCDKLDCVDAILIRSGIESEFAEHYLGKMAAKKKEENGKSLSGKEIRRGVEYAVQALRCNYLRMELGTSYRKTSAFIAGSEEFQRFTKSGDFTYAKVPGKSMLHEFSQIVPEEYIRRLNENLYLEFSNKIKVLEKYDISNPLDSEVVLLDAFCVKSQIHFPVDWVLLRDATRTLIKAIMCIRRHGLKRRIPEPTVFIRQINSLSIAMTHSRRKQNSQKTRKRVFRDMKLLVNIVKKHAMRYRDILNTRWEETDLSRPQAELILKRINNVIEQLPSALRQAHNRLIRKELTPANEKILSLYDKSAVVIVRGKDSAEVEFGNELLIAEERHGFIHDFRLYESKVADTNKLKDYLEHVEAKNIKVGTIVTDRGFDSKSNRRRLEDKNIINAMCPRSVVELIERHNDLQFNKLQKRRGQTEGRIAALKRFIGKLSPSASFEYKKTNVAWAVFSHNLNLLARLMTTARKQKSKAAA